MRKHTLLLLLFCLNAWSQDFDFLPKEYVKISNKDFFELKKKDSTFSITTFLDNGEVLNMNKIDSISKSKMSHKYVQLFFSDTLNKKGAIVLKKLTDSEIKERNKKFNDNIENDKKNRREIKGKLVENLNLTDLEGKVYTLEDLKGKIVVLNFWFTKCAPCVKEIPDLNKMIQKYGTEKVAYFAITFDNNALIDEFLKKHQVDFTIIPEDKKTIDQFNISFYPTNIVLDKEGKVVFVNDFFMKDMVEDMNKLIKKLLSKS